MEMTVLRVENAIAVSKRGLKPLLGRVALRRLPVGPGDVPALGRRRPVHPAAERRPQGLLRQVHPMHAAGAAGLMTRVAPGVL